MFFFFKEKEGIRDSSVTGVQTCALPISSTVPPGWRKRIPAAIQIYTDSTPIRWIPRTSETNYVRFRDEPSSANECGSSYVGRQGGEQDIVLNLDLSACDAGTAVHEMGHAVRFEHEQTPANRD